MPNFDFINNCNPCQFGWTRLVFSSLERAIQLSLDAVAVVARLVAFLGRRWYRTTAAAAAAAMTNESRQASPVPIWNERDM